MKNILKITMMLVAVWIYTPAMSQNKAEISIKTSSQCGECKERIEKAMAYEKGVKSAVLVVTTQMLNVVYDPRKTDPNTIRKAIVAVGYDADSLKADPKAYKALPTCCQKEAGIH
jgi:periplasmic mercuric ion binding protein